MTIYFLVSVTLSNSSFMLTNSSFMLRNTEDEDLITQLDVFDEGLSVDQEALEGMDISNHKDVFRAVYSKVRLLLID